MRVLILHESVQGDVRTDEADVLVQRDVVMAALRDLGHECDASGCDLDLSAVASRVRGFGADLVFNLVESLERTGRLIHLVPSLLDALGVRYTGARADAIWASSSKDLGKRWLRARGLPTPRAWTLADLAHAEAEVRCRVIVKSMWEHGSVGLDASSVMDVDSAGDLARAMEARLDGLGGEAIAEEFIAGREFNLSVLAGAAGPEVLPPAEIEFVDWDDAIPRIVDWEAKWDDASHGYHATPRRFDFPSCDRELLDTLVQLARDAWHAFGLRGWARVDFRVDQDGRPFILEVNTNPCLSPDAGFAAALARAGIAFETAIARILADALR